MGALFLICDQAPEELIAPINQLTFNYAMLVNLIDFPLFS